MTVLNSVLSHMRVIILAPATILSNEEGKEPVTYPQEFHKGKVGPSIKSSFYIAKAHLKLIRAGHDCGWSSGKYKTITSFFQHHVLHKEDLPMH